VSDYMTYIDPSGLLRAMTPEEAYMQKVPLWRSPGGQGLRRVESVLKVPRIQTSYLTRVLDPALLTATDDDKDHQGNVHDDFEREKKEKTEKEAS